MRILSVNVGHPQPNPWKTMKLTGIDKRPVDGPGMVTRPRAKGMGTVGLAGDRVYDVREHGVFGENLTTEGADPNDALIGERWRIGPDVVLEASAPRVPCGTFQGWLAQAGWVKRFTLAGRPGAYFRVIEPGEIQAGDPIEIVHRPDHDVTVAVSFRALTIEPDLLPRLLVADALPEELKDLARRTA
jgi:MOSC domain-containing protein YiiM